MKNKINVMPLADRVIIQPAEAEEKTVGGIILPDTAKEKPQRGTVIAVGKGKIADSGETVAMEIKEGDSVLYGKYSGTEIIIGNEEYLIMRESDIMAVFEK